MKRRFHLSVVLICNAQENLRESGSGFAIHYDGQATYVMTSNHVVRHWEPGHIKVNGRPATIEWSGGSNGIDLALLRVAGLAGAPPLAIKEFVKPKVAVYGYAFRHLYGEDYVRTRIEGKVSRLLSLQGKEALNSADGWEIEMSEDSPIYPGNSGAPLIEASSHQVVGVLTSRNDESGLKGIAISPEAIQQAWPEFQKYRHDAKAQSTDAEGPPDTAPGLDSSDPQRNRFGKKSVSQGRKLSAKLTYVERDSFGYDLIVTSTDNSTIQGPVRFFLHSTYPRSTIWIRKPDGPKRFTLRDIYSYGVYTAACQARTKSGEWVGLEYNLAELPNLPKRFLEQ